jgi:hypothetical protein
MKWGSEALQWQKTMSFVMIEEANGKRHVEEIGG